MIDYDKLKLIHELASKLSTHYLVHITGGKHPAEGHEFTLVNWSPGEPDLIFKSLDDLIEKLIELAKPEPKYKPTQEVWRINHEKIESFILDKVQYSESNREFMYFESGYELSYWTEEQLFPTRQALIEHQIAYWQSLSEHDIQSNKVKVDVDRCQHEPSGETLLSNPPWFKCIKCGDFYR